MGVRERRRATTRRWRLQHRGTRVVIGVRRNCMWHDARRLGAETTIYCARPIEATSVEMSHLPSVAQYTTILEHLGANYVVGLCDSRVRGRSRDATRTYGEVTLAFAAWFVERFRVQSSDAMIDVGSGVGNFALAVAALSGAAALGVEIDEALCATAIENARFVRTALVDAKYATGPTAFVRADARDFSTTLQSHVFINNFAIDDESVKTILAEFMRRRVIDDGTLVVLGKPLLWSRTRPGSRDDDMFRRFAMPVEVVETPPRAVSWKATPIDAVVYRVVRHQYDRAFGDRWRRSYNELMAARSNYGERN